MQVYSRLSGLPRPASTSRRLVIVLLGSGGAVSITQRELGANFQVLESASSTVQNKIISAGVASVSAQKLGTRRTTVKGLCPKLTSSVQQALESATAAEDGKIRVLVTDSQSWETRGSSAAGGKGVLAHRNKVAVFNHDGDVIFSASTRELGNAVKDACQAMSGAHK
jgi:hypothetical protein